MITLDAGTLSTSQTTNSKVVPETTVVYQCRRLLLYAGGVQCVDGTGAVAKEAPWTTIRRDSPGSPFQVVVFWLWEQATPTDREGPVITLGGGAVTTSKLANSKLVPGTIVTNQCGKLILRTAGIRCVDGTGSVTRESPWTTVRRDAIGDQYEQVSFWLWAPGTPRTITGLRTN